MTDIIKSLLIHSQLIFNILTLITLFWVINKFTKFSLKTIPLVLLFIVGFEVSFFEFKSTYFGEKIQLTPYTFDYIKKSDSNLVVVVQGSFVVPHIDIITKNRTLVQNHGGSDIPGLGEINNNTINDSTHISSYSGTHNLLLTTQDVIKDVYYFKQMNPSGKVVLVGHSLGAYNLVVACNKLNEMGVDIDLLIMMDPQSQNKSIRADETLVLDVNLSPNVKNCINYYVSDIKDLPEKFSSGGNVHPIDKSKSKVINYAVSKCTHTNIDNTLAKPISGLIKEYLETNQDPIELSKKIKKIKVIPNIVPKKISIFDLLKIK